MTTIHMVCELQPIYDKAKSFYSKARVDTVTNYTTRDVVITSTLISYQTECAVIVRVCNNNPDECKTDLFIKNMDSVTTLRHVKEFIRQYAPSLPLDPDKLTKSELEKYRLGVN